jgi:transcriptional regulator with XRE-family HTH domain
MVRSSRLAVPDSLGSWLAFYRERASTSLEPMKPEIAAARVGVSGSTLRRWENNVLAPKPEDVRTLGRIYALSGLETSFLLNCLLSTDEAAPEHALFMRQVSALLDAEHPAILLDQLFMPAAWNSLVDALSHDLSPNIRAGLHPLDDLWSRGITSLDQDLARRAVRLFWFFTTNLCGTDSYRRRVRHLLDLEGFAALWMSAGQISTPINPSWDAAPYFNQSLTFRVNFTPVVFPPRFFLLEYTPVGREAFERVQLGLATEPRIHLAS